MTSIRELNPLDIPEIVYHIGWHLFNSPEKSHATLAPCLSVNRLWNRTLTPIFWSEFKSQAVDELGLRSSFVKYSHHVRYASILSKQPTYTFTRLRELEIHVCNPWAMRDLTRSNPQLHTATISIGKRQVLESLGDILEPLVHLHDLTLIFHGGMGFSLDEIVRPLSLLPRVHRLKLEGTLEFLEPDVDPDELPLIHSLKHLKMNCTWSYDKAESWIPMFCPAIEWVELECRYNISREYVDLIKEYCPLLNTLRSNEFMNQHFTVPFAPESDYIYLISSIKQLTEFGLPLPSFGPQVRTAMLFHASTLETIHLRLDSANAQTFRNVSKLLRNCTKLRSFSLAHRYERSIGMEHLTLFQEHWKCRDLENFSLELIPTGQSKMKKSTWGSCNPDSELAKKLAKELWIPSNWYDFQYLMFESSYGSLLVLEALFKLVFVLPMMQRVTFDGVDFAKKGSN